MPRKKSEEYANKDGSWKNCEVLARKPDAPLTGEQCPFMGKRMMDNPDIYKCLLDTNEFCPKPCPGIFCTNEAMWPTCLQLINLCPQFRDLKYDKGDDVYYGRCTCGEGNCALITARKWQNIDGDGTTCPRMLGRVNVKKNKPGVPT